MGHRKTCVVWGFGLMLVVAACGSKEPVDRPSAVAPSQTGATTTPVGKPAKASPVAAITEAEARGVVDRWLVAQNQSDFGAYQSLYAQRFNGVKRSGPRTVAFSREGWLRDRQRMFAKPQNVEVADVQVDLQAGAAIVRLTQRWASSAYADKGPKQLRIVREEGVPRIGHEEMLQADQLAEQPVTDAALELLVVATDGAAWALIDVAPDDDQPGANLTLRHDHLVTAPLLTSDVTPERTAHIGQRVQVLTRDGNTCEAKLGPLFYVLRVVPYEFVHVGSHHPENNAIMDRQGVATFLWQNASERPIGAKLIFTSETCVGTPVLARPAVAAPWTAAKPIDAAPYRETLLNKVRQKPEYVDIQRRFAAEPGNGTDSWEGSTDVKVQAFRFEASQRTFVSVTIPNPTCTSFEGAIWVMFEIRQRGPTVFMSLPDAPAAIDLLFDRDGDGRPEYVGHDFIRRDELRSSQGTVLKTWHSDFQACFC